MALFRPAPLAIAALLALGAAPAFAGGLAEPAPLPVVPAPVAPPPAPSADWSGFYVGGQVGNGAVEYTFDAPVPDTSEADGRVYGVHAGYMQDFGRVVLGAELAYVMTDIVDGVAAGEPGFSYTDEYALDSVLRVGARAGFDAGRVLPFVSGGWARGSVSWSFEDEFPGESGEGTDTLEGFYYGGGVEFAVTDRFLLGAEVLRHEFEAEEYFGAAVPEDESVTGDLTTISLRGSFRF